MFLPVATQSFSKSFVRATKILHGSLRRGLARPRINSHGFGFTYSDWTCKEVINANGIQKQNYGGPVSRDHVDDGICRTGVRAGGCAGRSGSDAIFFSGAARPAGVARGALSRSTAGAGVGGSYVSG